jgi:mannose-6-phosphate isomerase-like protein (cupin superfamily)
MKVRRVVTGHTPDGRATVASDTEVDAITLGLMPGAEFHRLWGGDAAPSFPDDGSLPPTPTYFPPVGGFRFGFFTVPPKSVTLAENLNIEDALSEVEEKLPGLAAYMEEDNPGMHTTDTIDFEYVISGEVWLELDDGEEVRLRAGDTVVQNGTRHAWRNKGSEPCRMVGFIVGAHRNT